MMTKLKELRKARGLKLHQVAEQLNILPQTAHKQERDGIKTLRVAKKYAALYECDWKELLD